MIWARGRRCVEIAFLVREPKLYPVRLHGPSVRTPCGVHGGVPDRRYADRLFLRSVERLARNRGEAGAPTSATASRKERKHHWSATRPPARNRCALGSGNGRMRSRARIQLPATTAATTSCSRPPSSAANRTGLLRWARCRRSVRGTMAGGRYRPGAWRGGRADECTGLENRSPVIPDRGFESPPLRLTPGGSTARPGAVRRSRGPRATRRGCRGARRAARNDDRNAARRVPRRERRRQP